MNQNLKEEWRYRYEERIGVLCGAYEPTLEQIQIAESEADCAVLKLERDYFEDKIIQRDMKQEITPPQPHHEQ